MENQEGKEKLDSKLRSRLMRFSLPIFIAFWPILYFTIVLRCMNHLPTPLTIADAKTHLDKFIGERAKIDLLNITDLGPRVVGSTLNEVDTVNLIMNKLKEIKAGMKTNLYTLEFEVQNISGGFLYKKMYNKYAVEKNVVAKLTPVNCTKKSSFLLNSHFDSRPGSPGAGDDAAMLVVMMEVLRVLTQGRILLKNSVVFLFNGAEENPLQGSHGFITQHRWAPNCKAFLNMDAAGSQGKEVLFQIGPDHPWLAKYYRRSAPHPCGSSLWEELFQTGKIPSDTDFRIFRDFGGLHGYDMALVMNGYDYHTEYDSYDKVPGGTLQNTGENALAIVRSVASSFELEDPTPYAKGHVVFYDFMGWYLICYEEFTGVLLNYGVSFIGVVTIAISVWLMVLRNRQLRVLSHFGVIIIIQIASFLLGFIFVIAVAILMDFIGLSLVWYGNPWLIFGLYICPGFLGLTFIPSLYLEFTRIPFVSLTIKAQLFTHANCLLTILFTVVGTALSIRSSYICMLPTLFHILWIILDLLTAFPFKRILWIFWVILSQIFPFMYFSYLGTLSLRSIIPIEGRIGTAVNPEIILAVLVFLFTWLSIGFLIPVLYSFRTTRTICGVTIGIIIITFLISQTPAGFPFKEIHAPERFYIVHSRRVIRDVNKTVVSNQPIFYISTEERRASQTLSKVFNSSPNLVLHKVGDECRGTGLCNFPFITYKIYQNRKGSYYINAKADPSFPDNLPNLVLKKRIVNETGATLNFLYDGPFHSHLYFVPLPNCKIIKWSFNETVLQSDPPFFVYYSYGQGRPPMEFFIVLEAKNPKEPVLEVGISGHWTFQPYARTKEFTDFLDMFPNYAYFESPFASYENQFY